MTPDELIYDARGRHFQRQPPYAPRCVECEGLWPCDSMQLADALEAALSDKRAAMVAAWNNGVEAALDAYELKAKNIVGENRPRHEKVAEVDRYLRERMQLDLDSLENPK